MKILKKLEKLSQKNGYYLGTFFCFKAFEYSYQGTFNH